MCGVVMSPTLLAPAHHMLCISTGFVPSANAAAATQVRELQRAVEDRDAALEEAAHRQRVLEKTMEDHNKQFIRVSQDLQRARDRVKRLESVRARGGVNVSDASATSDQLSAEAQVSHPPQSRQKK